MELEASEVNKIINHIGPSMLHALFEKKDINVNIRDCFRAVQPKVRTTRYMYGLNSLKYNGAKIWNSLSVNIKCAISLNNFKCLIKKWNGTDPNVHVDIVLYVYSQQCMMCMRLMAWRMILLTCFRYI